MSEKKITGSPKGWEIKKLKDVCEKITDGTHQTPSYFAEGIVFLSSKNVTSGSINWNDIKYIDTKQHLEMHKRVAPRLNDVLLAKNGTTGVAAIVDRNIVFDIYVSLALLRPLKDLNPNYLLHFINSPLAKGQFNKRLKGIGVPNLHLEEIREVEIPLPPLPEQLHIVSILDKAFVAIATAKANAEQNHKNAKELFEGYLLNVIDKKGEGWKHIRLGDVCKINDGTHFSPQNSSDGEFMYITAKNIKPYYIDFKKISYISAKDHNEIYARCSPKKGDVLYIKDGATAGIAAINSIDEEFSLLSSVALLKCSPKILNTFLVHYMNSSAGRKNFLGYIDGAAITRLTLVKIKSVCFSLPPIEEQQSIVQKLDTLSLETKKLEAIYRQKVVDLEELKKSVLQKAFNGEL